MEPDALAVPDLNAASPAAGDELPGESPGVVYVGPPSPVVSVTAVEEPPPEGLSEPARNSEKRTHMLAREHSVLQRHLWGCLSAGAVVGGAGLGLASSAPPRPVGDVVQAGP
jgi:hypothetical protein